MAPLVVQVVFGPYFWGSDPMSAWQPIDEARPGVRVLVYIPSSNSVAIATQWAGAWRMDTSGDKATPTHWMPLPLAPVELTNLRGNP